MGSLQGGLGLQRGEGRGTGSLLGGLLPPPPRAARVPGHASQFPQKTRAGRGHLRVFKSLVAGGRTRFRPCPQLPGSAGAHTSKSTATPEGKAPFVHVITCFCFGQTFPGWAAAAEGSAPRHSPPTATPTDSHACAQPHFPRGTGRQGGP